MKTREELLQKVMKQLVTDVAVDDYDALYELLYMSPNDALISYLPENKECTKEQICQHLT